VRRAVQAANTQLLFDLKAGNRDHALLNSLSTYPSSKWLDTLPVVPSLRLDDQSFQDNARIRLKVRNFTTMSEAWYCFCASCSRLRCGTCLRCQSLNSLIIVLDDETADDRGECVGRLGFSSSREGLHMHMHMHMHLRSCINHRPMACCDFHCHVQPGPSHIMGDVSYIHPFAPSCANRSAWQACTVPARSFSHL
jgi:hypothetical protein